MTDILSEIVAYAGNKPRPVLTKCDKVGETLGRPPCGTRRSGVHNCSGMAMNPREFRQVFKVATRTDWERARATGTLAASKDDERDGFIHLSAAHQLAGTLAKHFKAQTDLVLIEFDAAALGKTLRWEPSRGNDLFPHQYGPLQTSAVRSVLPLQLGADGAHVLPQSLCKC